MMETFDRLFLYSTPLYIIIIGIEILATFIYNKQYYSSKGTLTNIYLTGLNLSLGFLVRGFCVIVLIYFSQFKLFEIKNVIAYWVLLLAFEDFLFYILHYVDHYCRFFWAVHVTHHSSEEFNLTVGFRSSVFEPLYAYFYFIPLVLCGFKPWDIMLMYSATQIYGILIHTQFIGKLGFVEWFMATPSNHRVHHGSNHQYLDKNMGMIFIIWDRIFGTYQSEEEVVRFGLTENINTYHPAKVVFHEWENIWIDVKTAPTFGTKFMYIFGPPGWSHDGRKKTSRQLRAEWLAKQKNSAK